MCKSFWCILLVFGSVTLFGQNNLNREAIEQESERLTALYQLDDAQSSKMLKIQERRFKNLSEISSLKSENYALFLEKRRAIRLSMESSIKKMLHSDQMKIFHEQLVDRRKKESSLIKKLKEQGASKEKIQTAVLEMETE